MLPKSDAVGYHTRFGIRDMQYPLRSIDVPRENRYTDCDLVDVYSVLGS
jgi:hypothetical protein